MGDVVVEDLEGEALERGRDGADLREHVDAVAILLHHPLDAAHLSLDAVEAVHELLAVLRVAVGHACASSRGLWKRRSRRLFVTTKTLEKAMAAAAMTGLSTPATASGIAATL